MNMYVFVFIYVFVSLEELPTSGIAGSLNRRFLYFIYEKIEVQSSSLSELP